MKTLALKQVAFLLLVLFTLVGHAALAEEESAVDKAEHGIKKGGEAAGRGVKKGAAATEKGLKKAGKWVEKGLHKAGEKIKKVLK